MAWDNHENRRTFENCYAQAEKRLNPLAHWPDSYIWDYSSEAGLEQCGLYQEGFQRLGCIGCPMAGEQERRREFGRWPKFQEQWFEWWLRDRTQETSVDEDQLILEGY